MEQKQYLEMVNEQRPSFDFKKIGPVQQGAFALCLVTFISLVCYILHFKSMQAWNMILSPIFLFCCYNPIMGAFHEKWLRYLALSFLAFVVLAMYIYVSGNFVSDFSYSGSDELQRITVLVVIFYFLLNLLCLMFRAILYMLEQIDE